MLVTHTGFDVVEQIVAGGLWGPSAMVVVDVGAGGGIDRCWAAFGERLVAIGFDPLKAEVQRLNELETRIDVRYEAARVGCRDYDRLFPPESRANQVAGRDTQPLGRSSAVAAHRMQQKGDARDRQDTGADMRYTNRFLTLDEYFANARVRPNVLTIATGGSDFQVLLGAAGLLASPDLLGVQVGARFHGPVHDYSDTFANIDRFLRERGFSVFDIEPHRYSRSALPAPFVLGTPAQTVTGQIQWCEAVYFRDLGHPQYADLFHVEATRERLLKLCCLYVLYGLSDCAAELLTSAHLADLPERARLLDALTPPLLGDTTYSDYMARFNENPSAWLPQNLAGAGATQAGVDGGVPAAGPVLPRAAAGFRRDVPLMPWERQAVLAKHARLQATIEEQRERIAGLKRLRHELRRRLAQRAEQIERLQGERAQPNAPERGVPAPNVRTGRGLTDFVSRVRASLRRQNTRLP